MTETNGGIQLFFVYDFTRGGFICNKNREEAIECCNQPWTTWDSNEHDYYITETQVLISLALLKRLGWAHDFYLDPEQYYYE